MNRILRLATLVSFAMAMALFAYGQRRGLGYSGHNRVVVKETKESGTAKVRALTYPMSQRSVNILHQAIPTKINEKPVSRILGDGTVIYGSLIYSSDWAGGKAQYGIYSFPASGYVSPDKVVALDYDANGGGCYANGKYYYNSYVYTEEMGYSFSTFCVYDFATGDYNTTIRSFLSEGFDQSQITHDMAYDPTTGRMFAISYMKVSVYEGLLEKFVPSISVIDPINGYVSPIAQVPALIAIAVNRSGELFGISKGQESALYRINKETGTYTEIGKTGLSPEYIQSATFDPVTDKLYWTATMINGTSGLYEVDVKTGNASKICDFAANEEYAGIYIPDPVVEDKAPAAIDDLRTDFDAAAHEGFVLFTTPSNDCAGGKLSGNVTFRLTVDGVQVFEREAQPGEKISHKVTLDEGVHGFTVTPSNAYGDGPRTGCARYVGLDAPEAVGNLSLAADDNGDAFISWTAPGKGMNDGYIDPALLTYSVVRMPGNVEVASGIKSSSYTDKVNAASDNYYYVVTPYCDGREGLPANTGTGIFGIGTSVPCKFSFDTKEEYDLFTVIDANHDYEPRYQWGSWLYGPEVITEMEDGCAVYMYSPENAADDWLITPPFVVQAGKKYRLTFTMWTKGEKETLTVTAGAGNTIDAQSVIIPAADYSNKDKLDIVREFVATSTGNYFIGFHMTSAKKRFYLFVDDIRIDEVPETEAPVAVSDLVAIPAEKGGKSVLIRCNAPVKTVGGDDLVGISRVDIYRGTGLDAIKSFNAPDPGERLEWTDNAPADGFNTYRIVAYGSTGLAGEKAETKVFVGYDVPLAPADVTLVEEDGHPVLRWTAPTQGPNGGYINPDELIYRIRRNDGTICSINATGTSYVDNSIDGTMKQHYIYYEIVPVSQAGYGDYALSNELVFGDPYKGDFVESFSDQATQNDPWTLYKIKGTKQLWGLYSQGYSPYCPAVDGDYGVATFSSSSTYKNDEGRMVSPKLDVSSFDVPIFTFYFYHNPSVDTMYGEDPFEDRLIPEVRTPSGEYIPIDDPIYVDDPQTMAAWYKYTYDLSPFKTYDYIQLSFHGIADSQQDINIDLVQLSNMMSDDLAVYSFSGPAKVNAGKDIIYKATVYNNGVNAAIGYKLVLYRDGQAIMENQEGLKIMPGKYMTYEFVLPTTADDEGKSFSCQVKIEYEDDAIPANNTSSVVTTAVGAPQYPEIYKLSADKTGENNVQLAWSLPDAFRVNDSFEDYAAFSIDNIGDYTLADGDEGYTYGFTDLYFQHMGEPYAYIVFNPAILGITPILPEYGAHTGNQVLAAFSAVDISGTPIDCDDWLVSPPVHGGQTISFYAKTANYEWGFESFEVLYSTSDNSTSSFRSLGGVRIAPEEWTLVELTLPADAKYFAIHYVSNDKFIFYIDDLKFVEKVGIGDFVHTGYKVYRNGSLIAELPADATGYLDTALGDGSYSYEVSAVYNGQRESGRSDKAEVIIGEGGIADADMQDVCVYVSGKNIIVRNTCGQPVSVTRADGVSVFAGDGEDGYTIPVVTGVYLVKTGQSVSKVVVR